MIEVEHRDFRDTLARCAELGGARLIVTSPPYLDSRARGQYGFDCPPWTMDDYEALGRAVLVGLMPGGVCALNIFGRVAKWRGGEFGTERSTHWMRVALMWQDLGLRYLECYAYGREGTPGIFGPRHRCGWEPVHIFARPGADVYFCADAVKVEAKHKNKTWSPGRNRKPDKWEPRRAISVGEHRHATTLVSVCGTGPGYIDQAHPAPFSWELADFFVLSYSAPGDLVCDPFTGSGTVAISAAKHGRRFIGGDLGARESDGRRWADIARERAMEIADPAQRSLFA